MPVGLGAAVLQTISTAAPRLRSLRSRWSSG